MPASVRILPAQLDAGRRHRIEGQRVRREHDPRRRQHGAHRRQHVVEDRVRRQRPPQRLSQGVDRAGRAHRRADRALLAAQPLLVAPVAAEALADVGRAAAGLDVEHQLAGDAADGRIGERRDQAVQRLAIEALADVGEDEDVVPRRLDAGVQRLRLAAAAHVDGVDEAAAAAQDRGGAGGSARPRPRRSAGATPGSRASAGWRSCGRAPRPRRATAMITETGGSPACSVHRASAAAGSTRGGAPDTRCRRRGRPRPTPRRSRAVIAAPPWLASA